MKIHLQHIKPETASSDEKWIAHITDNDQYTISDLTEVQYNTYKYLESQVKLYKPLADEYMEGKTSVDWDKLEAEKKALITENGRLITSNAMGSGIVDYLMEVIEEIEDEKKELTEVVTNLMKGVHELPPLTAIAGVLEDEYKAAENLINKLKQ